MERRKWNKERDGKQQEEEKREIERKQEENAKHKDGNKTTRKSVNNKSAAVARAQVLRVYFAANKPTKHHATKLRGICSVPCKGWQYIFMMIARSSACFNPPF